MIAALFILFGIATAQEPQVDRERIETITLSGVFVDAEKQPVAGATVDYMGGMKATTTNEHGEFTFELPACIFHTSTLLDILVTAYSLEQQLLGKIRGNHERELLTTGLRYDERTIPFFREGHAEFAPITITSNAKPVERTVTVVDAEGNPVEGALVGAQVSGGSAFGETDSEGRFSFVDTRVWWGGAWSIQAFKPGVGLDFIDQSWVDVGSSGGGIVSSKLPPPVETQFHFKLEGNTVKIRVVDESGLPVEGAIVESQRIGRADNAHSGMHFYYFPRPHKELQPWQARTNAEGIATFDWFPMSNLASVSFATSGGWNENHPVAENLVASGTWEKRAELLVNATFWGSRGTLYDRDADNNVWEEIDWRQIFDDIPEIQVTFQPQPPAAPVASAKITVRQPDGTPVAWYPFNRGNRGDFRPIYANINGELIVSGAPHSRYMVMCTGKTGTAPSFEIEFGEEGTEKQVDIVLQTGTKLFGNVTPSISNDRRLGHLRFEAWEICEVSGERKGSRTPTQVRYPEPIGPYAMLLPPGRFEIEVRGTYFPVRVQSIDPQRVYEFNKTLILDGTQDEIELDIVLEEVERNR